MVITLVGRFLLTLIAFSSADRAYAIELPKTDMTRRQAVEHLLNRAAFGPRPGQIDELMPPKKLEAWLDRQLEPKTIDDSKVEAKTKRLRSTTMTGPQLFENYLQTPDSTRDEMNNRHIVSELIVRKIVRAAESKRELEQVVADFWYNHFSVDRNFPHFIPLYEREAITPHVFGRFEDLLVAVAKHPAMLYYLDNWRSGKVGSTLSNEMRSKIEWAYEPPGGSNDNYAREVLELHTVGADAGYTERDIKNVARIFTGWTIAKEKSDPRFAFVPTWHDETDVTVLGNPYTGKKGLEEGLALLHDLAGHPRTAEMVARKLCLRFVDDPPPPDCIGELKSTYLSTSGDLKSLYKKLFSSPQFWEAKRFHSRFKGPFEFVASSFRLLGSDLEIDKSLVGTLNGMMMKSGQQPYSCKVPTGYSETNAAWNNPASTLWRSLAAPKLVELAHSKAKSFAATDLLAPEFQRR